MLRNWASPVQGQNELAGLSGTRMPVLRCSNMQIPDKLQKADLETLRSGGREAISHFLETSQRLHEKGLAEGLQKLGQARDARAARCRSRGSYGAADVWLSVLALSRS